jgi:hypothetical protein
MSFKITESKGFHITFDNKITVSVQWGSVNYCSNGHNGLGDNENGSNGSNTAECAVWDESGEYLIPPMFDSECGDTVKGWMSAKDVVDLLVWAEKQ